MVACLFGFTVIWSYGAENGKMILVKLGLTNFKATPGVKTTSPAGANGCIDSRHLNPFIHF
jgi:hypothetical protein